MPLDPHDLSAADRGLVLAAIAFGGPGDERLWSRLAPAWRDRLRAAWADAVARGVEPSTARHELQLDQRAEARPDPARVDPSWWLRAVRDESPAVRLALASHAPEPVASTLRDGLDLGDEAPDARAHPEALAVALAQWSERIVGGPPPGDLDPPVVVALATLGGPDLARLVLDLALAKWAYARAGGAPEPTAARPLLDRRQARVEALAEGFRAEGLDRQWVALAGRDLAAGLLGRRGEIRALGLLTIARLLTAVEPFRARWAMQHLPYDVARHLRSRMARTPRRPTVRSLLAWEGRILAAASALQTDPSPGGGPP